MKLSDRLRGFDPTGRVPAEARWLRDLPVDAIDPSMREPLVAMADEAAAKPLRVLPAHLAAMFSFNGNRSEFEAVCFERRERLFRLAFGLIFENRFLEPLVDTIWATCEETSWTLPAHQRPGTILPDYNGPDTDNLALFSAGAGGMLAVALHMNRAKLDAYAPVIGTRVERMLRERVLRPFLCEDWFFWIRGGNNWTPWVISNVFTVALALPLSAEEREAILRRALPMLARFADTYHDDGGCDEGPGYWSKAGASLFDCVELLYDLTGGAFDLTDDPQLRRMGEYFAKAWIAGSYYLNFADAPGALTPDGDTVARFGRRVDSDTLARFGDAVYLGTPDLDHSAAYRAYRNVCQPNRKPEGRPVFPRVWLDGLQVMTVRETDDPARGLFFACKGGTNAENHNHNDVGSFLVYQDGEPLLPDLGVGTYCKATFDPVERWKIFSMQSSYHNLPEVGGKMQLPGGEYRATEPEYNGDTLALTLTEAFPPEARVAAWRRTMGLRGGVVRVRDAFKLAAPDTVAFHFVTFERPAVEDGAFVFAKARMTFDPALSPSVEEHVFTDDRFVRTWGVDRFYRLALTTPVPVAGGDYTVEIAAR